MRYGGNFIVFWKEMKSVVTFTKDADEGELLKQFVIKDATKEIWQ